MRFWRRLKRIHHLLITADEGSMIERRFTNRCAVCSINWPYHRRFQDCPICDEETSPLRLDTPASLNDHILDWEEAKALMETDGAGKKFHRPHSINVEEAVSTLHRDLERWGREVPHWLKR